MSRPSLLGVRDPSVKRALTDLLNEIDFLNDRIDQIVSTEGALLANLPSGVKKSTSTGDKEVTAGAVSELDDLDDVPDGTTHGKVLNTEMDNNQVKRIRKVTAAVNVDGDDIIDKTNNDSDDVPEGTTKKFVGSSGTGDLDDVDEGTTYNRVLATEMSSGQVTQVRDTIGARNVTGDQIFDKGNDDMDNVSDGTTYKKLAGVNSSNKATGSSIADDAVDAGSMFSLDVQNAMIDYNTDSGPNSESEWDAI